MNQPEKLKKVLEVLISKVYLKEQEDSYNPSIVITDNDIEMVGMNFHTFNTTLRQLEELKVFERSYVSEPLQVNVDNMDIAEAVDYGITPRQLDTPRLRFQLFVLGNPWKVYEELEKGTAIENISTDELAFDYKQSVLSVNGFGVPIARQTNKPVEHYILKYIFDNDVKEQFSYTDLRQAEVFDVDVLSSTYINACKNLNKKIKEYTKGNIDKFLTFGSSDDGSVQINTTYLD